MSISKDGIYVYISRDNNRIYWIGSKKGYSAKLSIKFNDNKIMFHNSKDYEIIKKKIIYYKHMKEDEYSIVFEERTRR